MILEKQVPVHNHQNQTFEQLPPQVRIYNRNFYLRNARQQALQQEINKEIHQLAQKPKLTPNSYVILVEKLNHQIEEIYSKYLDKEEDIDFQNYQSIFTDLGKFQELTRERDQLQFQMLITQLWLILVHYDLEQVTVTKNSLTSLFNILFCPYSLKQSEIISLIEHAFPEMQNSRIRYMSKYPQAKDEVLETEGLVKLWIKVKRNSLYDCHVQKKVTQQEKKLPFKPQINDKSRVYAERSLQKYLNNNRLDNIKQSKLNELSGYISGGRQLSYHQILYKRGLEKQQILKTSRELIHKNQSQKTLTNQQTKKLVQNLYIIKEKKQDIDYQKIKEAEELKLCTFQPNTTEYHKRSKTPVVKNYEKQVQRLQKGRRQKQKQKEAYQNLGRVKQRQSGPPSFVERQKPKLILQIKLGDNVVKLGLKGDEQPRIVAKKFVIKHNLQQSMQEVLEQVIEEQLAALEQ